VNIDLCKIGVLIVSFFSPLLILSSSIARYFLGRKKSKKSDPQEEKKDELLKPRHFLYMGIGAIWVVGVIVIFSIYNEGKWDHYMHYIFQGTKRFYYHVPLGILMGVSLYFITLKIYYPLLRKILGRRCDYGRIKGADSADFLRAYASDVILLLMVVTNFAEEFIWRGFYIKAFSDWSGSLGMAVIMSSFFYGSYHFTFGIREGIVNGVNGVVYALSFVLTQDLTLAFTVHASYNLLAVKHIREMFSRFKNG
jgi:membrane protease YdiL (CAAX protease family)